MKHVLLAVLLLATGIHCVAAPRPADNDALAEFGDSVASSINEGNLQSLQSHFDARELGGRVSDLLELDDSGRNAFLESFLNRGFPGALQTMLQIVGTSGGQARFMRAMHETPARVLVRLDLGANGFDYLEFVVKQHESGLRAVDWFQLSSGNLVSDTMASAGQLLLSSDRNVVRRLLGMESVHPGTIEALRQSGTLERSGDYAGALAQLNRLPADIKDSRIMLEKRARLAALADRMDEYADYLAVIAKNHADDPSAAFMLVDHFFTTRDIPRLLKAIEAVERRVGRDAVTQQLRAAAYMRANEPATALQHAEESIRLEPERLGGYDTRASVLVALGRFQDAVAEYRGIEDRFDIAFTREIFTADPEYAKFVASPDFVAWLPE